VNTLHKINQEILACKKCPRLVEWREHIAKVKTKRFNEWNYWGKPVPGFGDSNAEILLVGLAPAAHGANRTGRMFTGDESGNWLYRALHKAGFASSPDSVDVKDKLSLSHCYVTATCRCAPPQNKLAADEIRNCRSFLLEEITLLKRIKVIIGLGKIGFNSAFDSIKTLQMTDLLHRPKFGHGVLYKLNPTLILIGSYHPSQQNTFTGKLTEPKFDLIFKKAKKVL
jgi:uracil-DNA glycosylase